jgi:hypothetical protein
MNIITSLLALIAMGSAAAPLYQATSSAKTAIDVSSSNVLEDLACFYHDQYPTNTLSYLVPHTAGGDKYNDFKFITMYANKGNLYLYFYSSASKFIVDDVRFEYSNSTTVSADKTAITENWTTAANAFKCTVHDHNGTERVFYKAVAHSFYTYNVGEKHRVKAGRLTAYATGSLLYGRECENAEYSWVDQADGSEQVYSYYKNNYIVIDGSKGVTQMVTTKYGDLALNETLKASELQWLFFSYSNSSKGANYDLGKLTAVSCSYEYLTYDATYRINRSTLPWDHFAGIYYGLYGQADSFYKAAGHNAREATFTKADSVRLSSTVTPNEKKIDEVTQTTQIFLWNVTHEIHYSYNTLQALDDTSVASIKDADFKSFIQSFRGSYKYAINFKEDVRQVTARSSDWQNPADWFNNTVKVTTRCHEAKAIQITTLTFENEDGKADFNALMDPVDVDTTVLTNPKDYKTVSLIKSKALQWFNGITIALIVAGVVVLGIYLFIVFRRFAKTGRMVTGFSHTNSVQKFNKPRKSKASWKRRK